MALFQRIKKWGEEQMAISEKKFGVTKDGTEVYIYEISNANGSVLQVSNLGAMTISLRVPDRNNKLTDVILGYDTVEEYEKNGGYLGAVIGRCGNRIAKGKFTINGVEYQMVINENDNNLHSGPDVYHLKVWEIKALDEIKNSITFYHRSPDKEQGFPGNFDICVTYELTNDNELWLHYEGVCDQDTVANMTNHSYFNLGGHDSGSVRDHELCINADKFTEIKDAASIPTGKLVDVVGTPMNFIYSKKIGTDMDADYDMLKMTGGYDHNFATNDYEKGVIRDVARAYCDKTGIAMTVSTDLPGLQFYCGNGIDHLPGKGGAVYEKNGGFCLETHYFPNAINQPNFISPLLKAGEVYKTSTCYQFTVEK
ncbi:MAG: aldose epimerase family protein [Lachnospiraceae bacterium]